MARPFLGYEFFKKHWLLTAFLGLLLFVLIRTAWISDDAYITLRVVDNFINGYGPTWNVAERVQVYTHPLWFLLLSLFSFVTRETYLTTLVISIILCLLTGFIFLKKFASNSWQVLLAGTVLVTSKAFIDFSTSGLENSLTNFLLALFLVTVIFFNTSRHRILTLSFLTSLLLLNRLDIAPLVAPIFAYLLFTEKNLPWKTKILSVVVGFLPLIAWEIFSLIYYGFLLPNTAYAKLSHGIPPADLMQQGFRYLLYNLHIDPVTALVIIAGIFLPWIKRDKKELVFSFSILLYLFYIVRVGGDFMAGRFLIAPFLVALVITLRYFRHFLVGSVAFIGGILILGLTNPLSPLYSGATYGKGMSPDLSLYFKVSDERANYYPKTGLLIYNFEDPTSHNALAKKGIDFKKERAKIGGDVSVGYVGYYAGPDVYILDSLALGDPLLSRLPIKYSGKGFFPGHYPRELPCGYKESLLNNTNEICDLELHTFYEKLRILTRDPIWSVKRFRTIAAMTLGRYDQYLEKYLAKNKP